MSKRQRESDMQPEGCADVGNDTYDREGSTLGQEGSRDDDADCYRPCSSDRASSESESEGELSSDSSISESGRSEYGMEVECDDDASTQDGQAPSNGGFSCPFCFIFLLA